MASRRAGARRSSPGPPPRRRSPGATSTRATRSMACWAPTVTTTSSPARDDRAGQPEEAGDLALEPERARARRTSPPRAATAAAGPTTSRRHTSSGNNAGSGRPIDEVVERGGRAAWAARPARSQRGRGRTAPVRASRRARSGAASATVGDVGARAGARLEEALGAEPVVGRGDRAAGDAQLTGQVAGRRDPVTGGQASVEHGVAHRLVDPGDPVAVARTVEGDVELHAGTRRGRQPSQDRLPGTGGHGDARSRR